MAWRLAHRTGGSSRRGCAKRSDGRAGVSCAFWYEHAPGEGSRWHRTATFTGWPPLRRVGPGAVAGARRPSSVDRAPIFDKSAAARRLGLACGRDLLWRVGGSCGADVRPGEERGINGIALAESGSRLYGTAGVVPLP